MQEILRQYRLTVIEQLPEGASSEFLLKVQQSNGDFAVLKRSVPDVYERGYHSHEPWKLAPHGKMLATD